MTDISAETVEIRDARPSDAGPVPALLFATNPALWTYVFGGLTKEFERIMSAWFEAGNSLASHSHAKVAVADDEPLGLLIAYDHATQTRAMEATLALSATLMPEARLVELAPRFHVAGYFVPAIPDDELYVFILSLLPAARSRGIGARLLGEVFERGRKEGRRAVGLDVYDTNPALHFYERHGMSRFVETRLPDLEQAGVATHYRMIKTL